MELRTEIVEAQKARADLFKWKIILVATLGSIALGVGFKDTSSNPRVSSDYLLCLIPLVCLYVDTLCSHMNMRMLVIGHYLRLTHLRREAASDAAYEEFAQRARAMAAPRTRTRASGGLNAYALENFAQEYSTLLFCFLVLLWGIFAAGGGSQASLFLISGAGGMVAASVQLKACHRRTAALDALVESQLSAGSDGRIST